MLHGVFILERVFFFHLSLYFRFHFTDVVVFEIKYVEFLSEINFIADTYLTTKALYKLQFRALSFSPKA